MNFLIFQKAILVTLLLGVLDFVNIEESLMSKNTKFSCNRRPWDCLSYFRISWSKDNTASTSPLLVHFIPSSRWISQQVLTVGFKIENCTGKKWGCPAQSSYFSLPLIEIECSIFSGGWYWGEELQAETWYFSTFHDFIYKWDWIYRRYELRDF